MCVPGVEKRARAKEGGEPLRSICQTGRGLQLFDHPLATMGGKALLGALLLASLCLAQPRLLKQSLSDVRGPVKDAASWALDLQSPAAAWMAARLGL